MGKFEIDYKKRMKENFRRLNTIIKMFNEFEFYSYMCDIITIKMQGKYKPEIVSFAIQHKFTISASEFGYIELSREFKIGNHHGTYEITLT